MRADIYDKTSEKNDIGRITVLQYVYVLKNRDPDLWSATDTYIGEIFSGEHVAIGVLSAV